MRFKEAIGAVGATSRGRSGWEEEKRMVKRRRIGLEDSSGSSIVGFAGRMSYGVGMLGERSSLG